MPAKYGDFNKAAKDACEAGKPQETKFKGTTAGGKYEFTQTKRTAPVGRDKAGVFSQFTFKKPWSIGQIACDEFIVDHSNIGGKDTQKGTSKWSVKGVLPDGKIKAKLTHGIPSGDIASLQKLIPTTCNFSLDWGKGNMKAGAGITADLASVADFKYNAEGVFAAAGGFTLGAMIKGEQGAKQSLDYNFAAGYAQGNISAVLESEKCLSVFNIGIFNKCSDRFSVGGMSTIKKADQSFSQKAGAKYTVDSETSLGASFDFGPWWWRSGIRVPKVGYRRWDPASPHVSEF